MLFRRKICIIFAAACIVCFAGCEKDRPESVHKETVKIGAIYPFTGHSASAGEDMKAGLELAADIINNFFYYSIPLADSKGLRSFGDANIKIIFKDSQSDENKAAKLVEELVLDEKVAAIIGCYNSSVTAAASEQAEIMKVPFLNAASTSPTLIQKGLRWFFRTTPDDSMFADNFFSFLSNLSKKKNIEVTRRLVLVYENRLWGTSVSRAERKAAMKYGYQIIEDIPYDARIKEFDEELRLIRSALPAVIMQTSYANDAVLFMKGYKANKINPAAILAMNAGFISPYFLDTLGIDGEHILSREVWAWDLGKKKPLIKAVNDLFVKRFSRNMTGNSARSFTGLIVLADAINRAKSLEPEKIRKALLETDIKSNQLIMPWDGVKFNLKTGQNILGKGIIVQVQGGVYHTVWPWELAVTPVKWPMPDWSQRKHVK